MQPATQITNTVKATARLQGGSCRLVCVPRGLYPQHSAQSRFWRTIHEGVMLGRFHAQVKAERQSYRKAFVLDPHASKLSAIVGPQNAHVLPVEDGQLERASMRFFRKKMSLLYTATYRYKRALQTMAAGVFLIYMTLVLYQNVYGYDGSGDSADPDRVATGDNLQVSKPHQTVTLGYRIWGHSKERE
uniref:Uncharacterized protein n=1 Tax=Anopheles culicifacies TaxID=139723 RepID=A0A182MF20_9DIPT